MRNFYVTYLTYEDKKLTYDDLIQSIVPSLNARPKITEVNFKNCGLDSQCAEAISHLKHVKKLYLQYNEIQDFGAYFLAKNKSFETLLLASNKITTMGLNAFILNESLECVDIRYQNIPFEFDMTYQQYYVRPSFYPDISKFDALAYEALAEAAMLPPHGEYIAPIEEPPQKSLAFYAFPPSYGVSFFSNDRKSSKVEPDVNYLAGNVASIPLNTLPTLTGSD